MIADAFGMHAVFAAPSYPAAPEGPDKDFRGVELGVALISRWPILTSQPVTLPARHRSWDPVGLQAQIDHPAGPLSDVMTDAWKAGGGADDAVTCRQRIRPHHWRQDRN